MTEIERFNKALIAATDRLELEGHSDCSNDLFVASNAILTTIESLQADMSKKGLANDMLLLSLDAIVLNSREQLTVEYARAQAAAARKLLEGDKTI